MSYHIMGFMSRHVVCHNYHGIPSYQLVVYSQHRLGLTYNTYKSYTVASQLMEARKQNYVFLYFMLTCSYHSLINYRESTAYQPLHTACIISVLLFSRNLVTASSNGVAILMMLFVFITNDIDLQQFNLHSAWSSHDETSAYFYIFNEALYHHMSHS